MTLSYLESAILEELGRRRTTGHPPTQARTLAKTLSATKKEIEAVLMDLERRESVESSWSTRNYVEFFTITDAGWHAIDPGQFQPQSRSRPTITATINRPKARRRRAKIRPFRFAWFLIKLCFWGFIAIVILGLLLRSTDT